jgi:hypothetical protein
MKQIDSSIDIQAPASVVWAILTDFAMYKRWNPYIRAILGHPSNGSALTMTLQRNGRVAMSTRSLLTHVREPRELRWRRRHLAPGLYTTEHWFRIESLPAGGVRFHQTERIRGLFASFLGRAGRRSTEESFHAMNHALKERAELLHTGMRAAGVGPT